MAAPGLSRSINPGTDPSAIITRWAGGDFNAASEFGVRELGHNGWSRSSAGPAAPQLKCECFGDACAVRVDILILCAANVPGSARSWLRLVRQAAAGRAGTKQQYYRGVAGSLGPDIRRRMGPETYPADRPIVLQKLAAEHDIDLKEGRSSEARRTH